MNKQMTAMEMLVLRACGRLMGEFAAKKVPPKTATLTFSEWEEECLFGPRYSPREWFGGGERISDTQRAKLLRVLHSLSDRGYLTTASYRGRLERVKLTDAGLAALGGGKPAKRKGQASVSTPPTVRHAVSAEADPEGPAEGAD